jgi:hypothetical protein
MAITKQIRTALLESQLITNITEFRIFNDRNKTTRRIKICGLPKLDDWQLDKLQHNLSQTTNVISISKHPSYSLAGTWSHNAIVIILPLS